MRYFLLSNSPITLSILMVSCTPKLKVDVSPTSDTMMTYDSILAKKLGANDYGMKPYVLAFLRNGPNRDQDSIKTAQLMRKHWIISNVWLMKEN